MTERTPPPRIRRGHFVVVAEVNDAEPPAGIGWRPGPSTWLVLNEPDTITDASWRRRLVLDRAHASLYSSRVWAPVSPESSAFNVPGWRVLAVEYVPTQPAGGLVVVHLTLDDLVSDDDWPAESARPVHELRGERPTRELPQVLNEWKALVAGSPAVPARILGVIEDYGFAPRPQRTPQRAALLTFDRQTTAAMKSDPTSLDSMWGGNSIRWYVWATARATLNADVRRSAPVAPPTPGRTRVAPLRLTVVDRDGFAMGGTSADVAGSAEQNYAELVPVFRSIYADMLILGLLQRVAVHRILDELGKLDDPTDHPEQIADLRRDFRRLRNQSWWQSVTSLYWPDDVLRNYQEENSLADLFATARADLESFDAEIQADRQLGMQQEQEATNQVLLILAIISLVGLVAGISGTWAAWAAVQQASVWYPVMVTAVIIVPAFAVGVWAWRRVKSARRPTTRGGPA